MTRCRHDLEESQCFLCAEAQSRPKTTTHVAPGAYGRAGRPDEYTAEEDELILAFPARDVAEALGRTVTQIRDRKQHLLHGAEMNLRAHLRNEATRDNAARHGEPWDEWEDEKVLGDQPLAELAAELRRTLAAVMNRRTYLKRERGDVP